ncbi:GntR family transcriptional regulator [Rhodococcus sp. B10]|uniref:GntR family transcriptional regulator n=1 Tax=Rhodococcus sp. B10 TaxID=2695876 RepID=UPI0016ABE4EC|nr:HTH-type transcriptional repressor RspR [Rhodococcus sp. B10]
MSITGRPSLPSRVAAPLRLQVVELLREALASGEYGPGQRLGERELCERFDVSRTVVREALRHLEAEGLVQMVANQGPIVATLTASEAAALFEVRGALEALAGQSFAVRGTPKQKRMLASSLQDVEEAMETGELADVLVSKDEFYAVLMAGAGNEFVSTMLRTIHARVQQLRHLSLGAPGRHVDTIRELRAIVSAIEDGDAEAARIACVEHVQQASNVALARLAAGAQV